LGGHYGITGLDRVLDRKLLVVASVGHSRRHDYSSFNFNVRLSATTCPKERD
jgi:hypothetical protein